jgi:uncharacterized sporulation protein YeaH/YhbH (DUF444 family)
MSDLLTKVKAALEAGGLVVSEVNETEATHTRNAGTDYNCRQWFVEHGDTLLNMARALIAETERREKVEAENAALREMQSLPPSGAYPEGELKRRMDAKVERRERIERAAVELADAVMEQANDGRESISPRVSVTLVKLYAAMEVKE